MIANLVQFIKASLLEVTQKVSWPTWREMERLIAIFFLGFLICALCVFGINRALSFVQRFVYEWMYKQDPLN